jgi:hypothetical protein
MMDKIDYIAKELQNLDNAREDVDRIMHEEGYCTLPLITNTFDRFEEVLKDYLYKDC